MLSAEGGLAVVPCPTVLPALAEAPTSHHDAHSGHHQHDELPKGEPVHDDRPCPYGVLSMPGLAPVEVGHLVRVPAFGEQLTIPEPVAPDVRPIASPPPPSRGPPSLS